MTNLCADAPRHLCTLCGICEKGEQKIARCATCGATSYCSKGCQKEHRKTEHKAECEDAGLKGKLERSQWAFDLAPLPHDQLQVAGTAAATAVAWRESIVTAHRHQTELTLKVAERASEGERERVRKKSVNGNTTVLAGAGANGDGEDGSGCQGVGDAALSIGSVVIQGRERAVHFNTKRGIVTRVLEGDRMPAELGLVRQLASVTQSAGA